MDFETPSGISDAPASQKTVLESTRTSGAQQSFRLELSEITPTSSSTPSISSSRAGSSVSVNPARIPFQTLLDELQVAESTAIDEDMMDMEDGEKDEEEGEGSQDSFIDDEEAEPSGTDWSEQEDTGVDTDEIVGISTLDSDAFNEKTKAVSKTQKLKAKQGVKNKTKNTSKRPDGAEQNTTTISIGNSSAIICNACKTPFTNKSGFTRHACKPSGSKSILDLTVLKCPDEECKRIFTNNSALTRHQLKAHGEGISKDVSSSSSKSSRPNDSKDKFQCDHCPSTYVKEFNLRKHVASKHDRSVSHSSGHGGGQDTVELPESREQLMPVDNPPQDSKFACDNCDAKYIKEINLRKHKESKHASDAGGEAVQIGDIQTGSKGTQPVLKEKFSCEKCDAIFANQGTLKKHVETKHIERVPVLKRRRSIEAHKSKASAKIAKRA